MRALELSNPEDLTSIKLVERDVPEPGAREVRVRFTSAGLNRADLLYPAGKYFFKPRAGSRLGFEGAGVIDAVGEHTTWEVGTRVAICPSSFDVAHQGCIADYGIFNEKSLILSPSSLNDDIAGAVWMAYLTAWGGLVEAGGLEEGQSVVITAASSSVGIAAIQVANMLGAIPIASTTSEAKAEQLRKIGARAVIVQDFPKEEIEKSNAHYVYQLHKLTDKQGSDLVFDAVAGPGSHGLIKGSKRSGTIVIHGLLDRRPMDVHAGVLMKRLLTLRGYTVDETLEHKAQKHRAIDNLSRGFNTGALKPHIFETFKLANFQDAFDTLRANKHLGKIVLTP